MVDYGYKTDNKMAGYRCTAIDNETVDYWFTACNR